MKNETNNLFYFKNRIVCVYTLISRVRIIAGIDCACVKKIDMNAIAFIANAIKYNKYYQCKAYHNQNYLI